MRSCHGGWFANWCSGVWPVLCHKTNHTPVVSHLVNLGVVKHLRPRIFKIEVRPRWLLREEVKMFAELKSSYATTEPSMRGSIVIGLLPRLGCDMLRKIAYRPKWPTGRSHNGYEHCVVSKVAEGCLLVRWIVEVHIGDQVEVLSDREAPSN